MTKEEKNEIKLIKMSAIADAIKTLTEHFSVFAPIGEAERQAFARIDAQNAEAVNLNGIAAMPPKDLLFPRSETLYDVSLKTGDISAPEQADMTVIFGARPCDARSFVNLDCTFLEKGYVDSAYAERRKNMTVIALSCATVPYSTCFCDSMGGGPSDTEGADVMLTETANGEAWSVAFLTEKGQFIKRLWEQTGCMDGKTSGAAKKEASAPSCSLKITKPTDLPAKLISAFEDPMWIRFSEACIGCGTCAYICPTCYCFDIDMETNGDTASEFRCWDCCMFSDYSRMAGGHNPRPTKKERLRNRYLHKLAYFDDRYGKTLCVGCGRCISKCPAGLDIASVIEWGGTL